MAVKVAHEIACFECDASVPKVLYLVLWDRARREYFPAAFGQCHVRAASWKHRPLGRVRQLTIFPRRRAAEIHAEKLNARRNWRPVPVTNTWSDMDR